MSEHAELRLGEYIEEGRTPERDAIHIAVMPAWVGEGMKPGTHVHLSRAGGGCVAMPATSNGTGIIDPFHRAKLEWSCSC